MSLAISVVEKLHAASACQHAHTHAHLRLVHVASSIEDAYVGECAAQTLSF